MSKMVKWALVLSLLLNILCVSVMAGHVLRRMGESEGRFVRMELAVEYAPAEKRSQMREHMWQQQDALKLLRKEMRKTRRELDAILRAETFDAGAFDSKAQNMHALRASMGKVMSAMVTELAVDLPENGRVALADGLRRPKHRRSPTQP